MPVDPELLDYVLRTPLTQDVADSPLVTGVILTDPANAGISYTTRVLAGPGAR